jgi:hypothetical protein
MINPPKPVIAAVQPQNFNCVVGDDFYVPMTLIDEVTGQPVDITGWQFFLSIYQSWQAKDDDDEPLISLSNDEGFTITSGTTGQFDMTILSAQTGTITIPAAQPYNNSIPQNITVYDFVAKDQNNLQRTRMRGNFVFQQRLTITS